MQVKVKTPAKINLTLEVLNKRKDGFHNIQSVMQTIDLYDYLTINIEEALKFEINLSGTSEKIPYDERNIIYKAVLLYIERVNLSPHKFNIHIEKNIPVEAGLAGGSTNAAGTFLALNELFNNPLNKIELHELCAKSGSDLNVCLEGGCLLATGRGENIEKLPFIEFPVSLIKPDIGISAKEGYIKYSQLENKPNLDNTSKMVEALKNGTDIKKFLHNDLEIAVFQDYEDLRKIKTLNPDAIMSGSGSTYFVLSETINQIDNYWYKAGLKTISTGATLVF